MAHLLSLLVLLFLTVHVHVSHGSPLPLSTYDDSMCSESFICGGVDIRYPFYLSDATRAFPDYTSNYSCGYTDLKIFCLDQGKAKAPVLHLEGDRYTILDISYDNHTIILGDADVLGGSSCPRVSHNVSFSQEWLNYTDSLGSLAFFFDCYSAPGDQPPSDLQEYKITCDPPTGSGDGVSFVLISGPEERTISQDYQLADHCKQNFVVPVHEDVLLGRNPSVLPGEYGALLKQGFELEWNKSTSPACHQCEQSGGRCSYSDNRNFLGCLCSGGKVGVQDCSSNGNGNTTTYADSSVNKKTRRQRQPTTGYPGAEKLVTCKTPPTIMYR